MISCAGEDGPVEARAQEGQPAPPDPASPNLISTSTAAQTGGSTLACWSQRDLELSLLTLVDEILVNYVATHEIDDRPVYDHKTNERLSPHLVKVGRQTEHDAMTRHQLFVTCSYRDGSR